MAVALAAARGPLRAVCCASSPSAALLLPVHRRVKERSRGQRAQQTRVRRASPPARGAVVPRSSSPAGRRRLLRGRDAAGRGSAWAGPPPRSPCGWGATALVRVGLLGRSGAGGCPNLLQRRSATGSTGSRTAEYQRFFSRAPARSGPLQQIWTTRATEVVHGTPRTPLTDSRAAAARLGVKASGGIRPDRLTSGNRGGGAPAVDDEGPPMTTRRADSRLPRSLTSRASGTYY